MLKALPVRLCNWIVSLRLLDWFTNYGTCSRLTTTEYLDSITNNQELKAVLAYCFGDYGQYYLCCSKSSRSWFESFQRCQFVVRKHSWQLALAERGCAFKALCNPILF